jgi:two-component system, NarL family, sensor histidine kinase UhpB
MGTSFAQDDRDQSLTRIRPSYCPSCKAPLAFDQFDPQLDTELTDRAQATSDTAIALQYRQAEAARRRLVRERDDLLARQQLQLHMPIACIVFDPQNRIIDWNPAAEKIFGYRREEVVGRNGDWLLVTPSIHEDAQTVNRGPAAGEMLTCATSQNLTKTGRIIVCEWHKNPVRNADGKVTAVLAMAEDVTERAQNAEKLRRRESELAEAEHLAHIGSWNWDIASDRVVWSDEHYLIFGLRPQDGGMTYQRVLSHVQPDDVAIVQGKVSEALRDRQPFDFCFRAVHPDGTVRIVRSRGQVVFDELGQPVGMSGTAQDVTERRRVEEAMRDSAARLEVLSRRVVEVQEEERRHLARELHDEIGQVLSVISVNLHGLKGVCDPAAGPRIEESIQIVDQATQQVRSLSLDLRPSMLDDLGLVATLRWYADRQAERAGFAMQFAVDCTGACLPPGLTTACFRVVQEALTNVVRHARARQVRIDLRQGDEEVDLLIRDDGVGFDPEIARRRAARGQSLGLLGMQERVALLGGRADIQSQPGLGTTVRVWFPLAPSPGGAAAE